MSKHIFWVASYPKSGNTLLRTILCSLFFTYDGKFNFDILKNIVTFEEMARLKTCSATRSKNLNGKNLREKSKIIYENIIELQNKENLGFSEDFAFFKTHFNTINENKLNFLVENYIRGIIYIYRDPRDVCVSWARYSNISYTKSLKFLLNKEASIKWTANVNLDEYEDNIPVYMSSWDNHVDSWTNNNLNCPLMTIKYENLVYNKEREILKLVNFFDKNYNIKVSNLTLKINNILKFTDFKYLQKLEETQGFMESVVESKFFAVGKKNQWKTKLNNEEINLLESKFKLTMNKLKYQI